MPGTGNEDGALEVTKTVTSATVAETSVPLRGEEASGPADRLGRGTAVDRYVILRTLGAGGMGVVYAAYDPELDRRIALKLLLPSAEGTANSHEARTRLLREAQALAKLSHPNVVAVHDAGEHDTNVWLAMEFVEGVTLRDWLSDAERDWSAVLDVMGRAAKGLAAAHAKGLLHRDFKPDNVMVDDEGRVRVMDFGLARREEPVDPVDLQPSPNDRVLDQVLTRAGSVMGTPAYMAPEQHLGTSVDARGDQFSFCVTLWEALYGKRPFEGKTVGELAKNVIEGTKRPPPPGRKVPKWLRSVCERGLEQDPENRFPSMDALLQGIDNGRRRGRNRAWLLGAGALSVAAAAVTGYQMSDHSRRVAACEDEGESIREIWNDEARARVKTGLEGTQLPYAKTTAVKVMPWLDERANRWSEARTQACVAATVDTMMSAGHYDKATWCLQEQRNSFQELVEGLAAGEEAVAKSAVRQAASARPASLCLDAKVLANLPDPPPPEDRAQVSELRHELRVGSSTVGAGEHEAGLEIIVAARERAEELGWTPLLASAYHLEGSALERAGRYEEAEAASIAGYTEAVRVGAWDLAATSAMSLAFSVGYKQARYKEGMMWGLQAEMMLAHAGDPVGHREAERLQNLGPVVDAAGDPKKAREMFQRAVDLKIAALGEEHPDVAASLGSVANATDSLGEFDEAIELYKRVLSIQERTLGPEHPRVANTLNNLGTSYNTAGRRDEAKEMYERALAIRLESLGPNHREVAGSYNNLASVHVHAGDYEKAREAMERALEVKARTIGTDHPDYALSLSNLAFIHVKLGNDEQALDLMKQGLAIEESRLGPDHVNIALSLHDIGRMLVGQEKAQEAVPLLERSLKIFEAKEGIQEVEPSTRFLRAKALLQTGAVSEKQAIAQARRARDEAEEHGGRALQTVKTVEKWLASRTDPVKTPSVEADQ